MKALLCELILSCALGAPAAKPVEDLTYGTVLYEYFQQDHVAALVNAEVAQLQGRTGDNPVRFDLARGSFAFSEGMYGYARATFGSVDEAELTEIDRLRLAFHLAREYHRRGDWASLDGQLQQIDLGKSWFGRRRFHPEVEYMRSELFARRGDFAAAEAALGRLDEADELRAYGLYNLGVAYRSAGNLGGARDAFANLALAKAYSDEAYDLSQRAKVALSFISRAQQRNDMTDTTPVVAESPGPASNVPATKVAGNKTNKKGRWWIPFDGGGKAEVDTNDAASLLGALPGEGRYRDIALAAYGGLAMDTGNYPLAARIWLTLGQQDYWTTSTATARLGYPMSLERLASTELALVQYRAAESAFQTRLTALDTVSSQAAEDPAWVRSLLQTFANPRRDPERVGELMNVWRSQLGHTQWLEWLSTEEVHGLFGEWRQLNDMMGYLGGLPEQIDALRSVSAERRHRSAQARTLLLDDGLTARRDELQAHIHRLAFELAQLESSEAQPTYEWMTQLTTPEERELLANLFASRDYVGKHMPAPDQRKWLPRIARLVGVVFYRVVNERAARTRERAKTLANNRTLLAGLDEAMTRVAAAEGEFVAGVETDFLQFEDRVEALTASVGVAIVGREQQLAQAILDKLHNERGKVAQYLLVTRVAIARATDALALQGDGQ